MRDSRTRALRRDERTYEFFVRYPWGLSAINGYRRAARHFGLRTLEDPSCDGADTLRLLVHRDPRKLRLAAKVLGQAYSFDGDDDGRADDAEAWLAFDSGVHWFHHDWKWWNQDQDEGALERLRWKRTIVETKKGYRVTVRAARPRRRR